MRYSLVFVFVALNLIAAKSAVADSVPVLPSYPPRAKIPLSTDVSYDATTGLFEAKSVGPFISIQKSLDTKYVSNPNATFDMKVFFDTSTGKPIFNSPGNLLVISDLSGEFFKSTTLDIFYVNPAAGSIKAGSEYRLMWKKGGGSLALSSPMPFIGAIIAGPTYDIGAPFDGTFKHSFHGVEATTNVFMTPLPTARTAGLGLFGLLLVFVGFREVSLGMKRRLPLGLASKI